MIAGLPITVVEGERAPRPGKAGCEAQLIAFPIYTEQSFEQEPIHPTGGTGVPGPTTAAGVGRDGIDIRGDDVGFDFVGRDLGGGGAVVDGIEQSEQFPARSFSPGGRRRWWSK